MATGVFRYTWKQRKQRHRYLIFAVLTNAIIGLILVFLGIFAGTSVDGKPQLADRDLLELALKTITIYGIYIFLHNLVGVNLCYNYFHHAEGSWMNARLFAWTVIGGLATLVGCFMASLCLTSGELLALQMRRSLLEGKLHFSSFVPTGMKKYLIDVTWKRKMDGVQVYLQCCGIDSFDDWHKTYWLQRDLLQLDSPDILEYAELNGRVTPPVVPWSCCRPDVKGPCYHDPLQLTNPEQDSTYESLNTRGCLAPMKAALNRTLYFSVGLIVLLFVSQVGVTVLSRLDFTAARNAVALGDRWGAAPGWLYGRLDFGNAGGPNLCQIDRKYSGRGDSMIDLRPLVCTSDDTD